MPACLQALDAERVEDCVWLKPRVVEQLARRGITTIGDVRTRYFRDRFACVKHLTRPVRLLICARLGEDLACPQCGSLRIVYRKTKSLACENVVCRGLFPIGSHATSQLSRVFPYRVSE